MSIPETALSPTHLAQVIEALEHAAYAYEDAQNQRVHTAKIARKHGITNQRIGDILGMSESGVRMMLNRAGR